MIQAPAKSAASAPEREDVEERKERAVHWFCDLRDHICAAFETIETELQGTGHKNLSPGRFERKIWQRENDGGGGEISIMRGRVFEKVGVNISTVYGQFSEEFREQIPGAAEDGAFWASGISVVAHMRSPLVPAVHMNTRHIVTSKSWFGGGMDLTPYYGFADDARHFHATCRAALDPFGAELYPRFKQWCDRYFYLPHRGEPRGIGGIFYDDFNELGFDACFALMRAVGDGFSDAYLPVVERRRALVYGAREREFQAYRRGRYVEFNLVHDRGTLFGLQSAGRTESILLSMPPGAAWRYAWQPEPGTPEAALYSDFLPPRDWA